MKLIEQFFALIAPNSCLGCDDEGSLLCYGCCNDHLMEPDSRCYKCNRLTKFGAVCTKCQRKTRLKHVFVRSEYTGSAKELIHRMKFSYSGEAADIIASELLNTLPSLPADTIIVHVPTITNHIRSRGFDHAKRIASGLSRETGLVHVPALARLGQHRQVGSKRRERLANIKDVFRPQHHYLIKNAKILLVDDVLTTGATLEAAANALKKAGAKTIDAVIFARAR